MVFSQLESLEMVRSLVEICDKYSELFDVDIQYGRYTVDGCSVLGVASMLGKIVTIVINTSDTLMYNAIMRELVGIGAWENSQIK